MKILQLVQKPQRRGAEVFAHQLSQTLRSQGQQVQSVYLYPHRKAGGLLLHPGDQVFEGQSTHPFEKLPGVHPTLLCRLQCVLNDFQPDVVQVNGANTVKYGAFARMLQQRTASVLIYRNIGNPQDWVRGWQRRWFYRYLVMPQIDGVVGVSQMTLQVVKNFYGLTVPLQYIPNGITIVEQVRKSRPEICRDTQTPAGAPVLLFVGSLSIEKRVDRLLRVVRRVWEVLPDLHVWLVGDGPQRQALTAQVEAMKLSQVVHFLGVQEEVASFMAAADLFLLTSDTEGIPAVVLEAGAQGVPVVATRVGGMNECIRHEETGVLFDPQDEAGLTNAVLRLLQEPAYRQSLGQQAKTWVRTHFAMDLIAQQYLAFYEEVIAQRRDSKHQCQTKQVASEV